MPDFEAIGDIATGGMVSRAVEPSAGETGYTHETHCLNCGAELLGPYCAACGQHAHVHRTLTAFFHDLLHGVLHFEGKTWRTLPMLAWKPGELTRNYIDGQRARYVSPMALFLFCVFLTFAVMSLTGSLGANSEAARKGIASELHQDQKKLSVLQEQRATATGAVASKLDEQISSVKSEMSAFQAIQDKKIPTQNLDIAGGGTPDWLVEAMAKAKENPELVFFKLKMNAYKFGWALIPISVPFVWMLFPFSRRFRLYDHTVFVTYSLSFMMLLLVTATLAGFVSSAIASLAWFIPPIHMYRQLRGTYGTGRWGAIWRTGALTIFAFIAISMFVSLLVGLGSFE